MPGSACASIAPPARMPERGDRIGREGLSVVPTGSVVDWSLRGLLILLKMGRESWVESNLAA